MVKSPFCSSRGPKFTSQRLHGSEPLSVTPALGDLRSRKDTHTRKQMHANSTYIERDFVLLCFCF